MSFPSRLLGLNRLSPSGAAYSPSPPHQTDAELAHSLALWTNADFSYDDGGVGVGSAQKLLDHDDDPARLHSVAQPGGVGALDFLPGAHDQAFFGGAGGGADDPFIFNPALFAFPEHDPSSSAPFDLSSAGLVAPSPSSIDLTPASTPSSGKASSSSSTKGKKAPAAARSLKSEDAAAAAEAQLEGPIPEGLSAEDDKRRRNTAASARFRQKKKEREKALESSAKDLQTRCANLEKEVESLRRENSWLKGLVVGGAPAFVDTDGPPADKKRRVD